MMMGTTLITIIVFGLNSLIVPGDGAYYLQGFKDRTLEINGARTLVLSNSASGRPVVVTLTHCSKYVPNCKNKPFAFLSVDSNENSSETGIEDIHPIRLNERTLIRVDVDSPGDLAKGLYLRLWGPKK